MMNQVLTAIRSVEEYQYSVCKFITKNESTHTQSHQGGLCISKNSYKLLFDEKGSKDDKKTRDASILWYDGIRSICKFYYYGSKNEYRITRLDRRFEIETFIIIVKISDDEYLGFILTKEIDVKKFLEHFKLFKNNLNKLII
ncbi:hypothetical protein ACHMWN_10575 [Pedobacter sp. UC225_61]|uniref:hypothetical protein n=1 Tax=Pedobacter sp. UC225_61 TaxID=3374623 RepID=UPI0037980809